MGQEGQRATVDGFTRQLEIIDNGESFWVDVYIEEKRSRKNCSCGAKECVCVSLATNIINISDEGGREVTDDMLVKNITIKLKEIVEQPRCPVHQEQFRRHTN
jgi:hypothetical protein